MRALFFYAAARQSDLNVVVALMGCARKTLRPFQQFIKQAIHTANERQSRYQLAWERVRNLHSIRLEPLDSILRVPRRRPGLIVTNWPSVLEPDQSQPAFVVNRGMPVKVTSATMTPEGLLVQTDPIVAPDDEVIWCKVRCSFVREEESAPPKVLTDENGKARRVVAVSPVGNDAWSLVVEGRDVKGTVCVDGEYFEPELTSATEDLQTATDAKGVVYDVKGSTFRAENTPAVGNLIGDNGVRFRWSQTGAPGRQGQWIQLLAPEILETDELLDPRAAFCEGELNEVWTSKKHRTADVFRVKKVDQDRYQLLLDRLPPEGSSLFLPVDVRTLYLQGRALRQLAEAPLPHHQGLLRLAEDPKHVRWPAVIPRPIAAADWKSLTDESRSGTLEQRAFVSKALASPDFAFLEGPPGSGKTTAICEIIQQLVAKGKRVLLCASTNIAIDNVLERLLDSTAPIDAVRIGRMEKVDDKVLRTQLDNRVEDLIGAWRQTAAMKGFGDDEMRDMAERTVIMAANLTCGTTMGIVNHPLFVGRGQDFRAWERPITSMPHWDVLIVDEASKTLIQEFMIPALMAKRWIIVGDVRQLPPFADREDIIASLRNLVDDDGGVVFPPDHQRAVLILFRLLGRDYNYPGMRWLITEDSGVLGWIARELTAEPEPELTVVRVVRERKANSGPVVLVTVDELRAGDPNALHVAAADWVLVPTELLSEVSPFLPSNLFEIRDRPTGRTRSNVDRFPHRQTWWFETHAPKFVRTIRHRGEVHSTATEIQGHIKKWFKEHDFGLEVAWRLTRLHELRHSRKTRERERLSKDVGLLVPRAVDISGPLWEIQDIGLPSILEVLQEGIGQDRTDRPSALTSGFRTRCEAEFQARFGQLTYQHRMNPEISAFSRDVIYDGKSLKDANTIEIRDRKLGWDFGAFRSRRIWVDVRGRETSGVNADEVEVMRSVISDFIDWANRKGPPQRKEPRVWEVACLTFYVKQDRAISEMLQRLTGDDRKSRFTVGPVEIVCGTVDRFQGREADLVLLSMRNTRRIGFLDSPNRLNVAVTRARQQLVVIGNAEYFGRCDIDELQELVKRSPALDGNDISRGRGRKR